MLRYLITNWLRNEATRRAKETVADALKPKGAGAASEPAPSEDATAADGATEGAVEQCHVGVVFALPIEAGGFLDRLSGVIKIRGASFTAHQGGLHGRRIVVVVSGPGIDNAILATSNLIAGHRPTWIVSAGFAGGLVDGIERGDIFMADSVSDLEHNRFKIDVHLQPGPRLHVGRLLSVDRIIRLSEEKRALGQAYEAIACDMETCGVAAVCQTEKTRLISVRAISDGVHDQLPPDIEKLMNQKTLSAQIGAVTGSIFRRPSSVKDMWNLKEQAILSSDRLAKFLDGIIAQLPPKDAE